MSETSRLSIPELDEFKDEHELNDIQSEFYSITNTNNNSNSNSIYKMITFRSNNNKSLYILMIGILGAIAMIICISLATTTSNSIISDSNRDILSVGATSSNETPTQSLRTESPLEDNQITPEESVMSESEGTVEDIEQLIKSLLDEAPKGSVKDKALGSLLGSGIGDAAGLPIEFYFGPMRLALHSRTSRMVGGKVFQIWEDKHHKKKYKYADEEYEQAVKSAMEMEGGGFFNAAPGQSSDDTAMAVQMARGFIVTGETETDQVNVQNIRKNNFEQYYKWTNPNPNEDKKHDGFKIRNRPFDIGFTIRDILKKGVTVDEVLKKTKKLNIKKYKELGSGVWSNGALMRIAPMAVYCLHLSDDDVYKVVDADLSLTNNNPFVTTAVTTYVLMAREMIKEGGTPKKAFDKADSFLKTREPNDIEDMINYEMEKPSTVVLRWINEIREDNKPPKPCDEENISTIETGFKQGIHWLNDADFRTPTDPDTASADSAEERHLGGPNFAIAMRAILMGKGDTDTNAAIWGVLGGAQLGIHGIYKLPEGPKWLEKLLSCSVDPHPRVIDGKTSKLKDEVEANHNPYLAKQYVIEGIWKRLIEVAPKSITGYKKSHFTVDHGFHQHVKKIREEAAKKTADSEPKEAAANGDTDSTKENVNARPNHWPPVIASTKDGLAKNHFKKSMQTKNS